MKPLPWSFTALEQADNCLHQYEQVRIKKLYPFEANSPEAAWGRYVHKSFEDRIGTRTELPQDLAQHEPFMQRIESWENNYFAVEQKVALTRGLKPTHGTDWNRVWWRGDLDYHSVNYLRRLGKAVDYKTGKRFDKKGNPKVKSRQTAEYALWMFAMYPDIDTVDAMFYWTTEAHKGTKDACDRFVYTRDQIPELWEEHVPSLTHFAEAFANESFPPTKSGLCNGWCPVSTCKYYQPPRDK